jgi:hypothetical protein
MNNKRKMKKKKRSNYITVTMSIASTQRWDFFTSAIRAHYVALGGLKFAILLPQPPKCWDYRHTPPYLANHFFVCFLGGWD